MKKPVKKMGGGKMVSPSPVGGKGAMTRPAMPGKGREKPMQMGRGFPGGPPLTDRKIVSQQKVSVPGGPKPGMLANGGGGRLVPPNQGKVPITTMPLNPQYKKGGMAKGKKK